MRWWAVFCEPQREAYANWQLKFRKGFVTYFPHAVYWNGNRKSVKPTLGRYMFVRAREELLHSVLDTPGVAGVVGSAGVPRSIPDGVMELLMGELGIEAKEYTNKFKRKRFAGRPGQRFQFGEGSPFSGLTAEILKVVDNNRLIARLESALFGSQGRQLRVRTDDVGELLVG